MTEPTAVESGRPGGPGAGRVATRRSGSRAVASRIVIGGLSLSATFTIVAVLAAGEPPTEEGADPTPVSVPTAGQDVAGPVPAGAPPTTIVVRRHFVPEVSGSAGRATVTQPAPARPPTSASSSPSAPAPAVALAPPTPRPTTPPAAATRAS